jgi:ATP-dependent Lon protease, bacterial type
VKEKVLAAHRGSIGTVLLPEGNRKDLDDIPAEVREAMRFVFASTAAEALAELFEDGAIGPKTRTAAKTRTRAKPRTETPQAARSPSKKRTQRKRT